MMKRRLRSHFVILLTVLCLGVLYTLFFLTGKPVIFGLNILNRERTGANSPLFLNAVEQRQDGVNKITGTTKDIDSKLRQRSDRIEFRIFKESGDHLMYLYDLLLTSLPWESNPSNLAEFREKLLNHTNSTFQDEFVLTHRNVRVGDRLPYSFTNTRPDNKTFFYKLSKKFIKDDVPPISPLSGKRFKRCSVVGNSGILSNSKCGKEIDQSDYVIRSNFPPIRPHVADAGWKTNITTMNPSIIQRRFKNLKTKEATISFVNATGDYYGVLWLPCVASTAMIGLCLKAKHTLDNYGVRNPETSIANPLHYLAILDFWKERKMTEFLSTGFFMTHLALTMCEETHLYGFWPFPYRVPDRVTDTGINTLRKVKYHYFDKIGSNKAHSMNDEFSVLLQMHVLGLLKLHVRDCDV
ncbi:sia-alpha-2,3-Gal-beta-1,4-GlcNAc-R:alpha 2,8-sialyltransferase-like [Asterias rubens]|uniref:sia-alpha-2,3-Gal-beta-1,4-GlcNAc-R:alpha 2,8-sialyltransferase-like n=1 Tax=Asterias rubens TaxID=7604 RepID=UPI0014558A26|nr:sia-alpha-2,3-Gal-beta-1,4-GlcNAc-R:alpha 2,8-sialyltransferase-like [Asterias rubens]